MFFVNSKRGHHTGHRKQRGQPFWLQPNSKWSETSFDYASTLFVIIFLSIYFWPSNVGRRLFLCNCALSNSLPRPVFGQTYDLEPSLVRTNIIPSHTARISLTSFPPSQTHTHTYMHSVCSKYSPAQDRLWSPAHSSIGELGLDRPFRKLREFRSEYYIFLVGTQSLFLFPNVHAFFCHSFIASSFILISPPLSSPLSSSSSSCSSQTHPFFFLFLTLTSVFWSSSFDKNDFSKTTLLPPLYPPPLLLPNTANLLQSCNCKTFSVVFRLTPCLYNDFEHKWQHTHNTHNTPHFVLLRFQKRKYE